jgi:cytochrome c oxidase subunit 2
MALFVFIVVEAVLFYSVFRFRSRGNDQAIPAQWHGNTTVEIMWTIAPAVVLGIIFVMTARTMFALTDPPKTDKTINVRVIGHQWWWEFQYPDYKANYKTSDGKDVVLTTASDLHVPEGYLVKYTLESVDVIHSFWIPQLSGKTDLIPGHINKGSFYTSKSGDDFWGQCAEFCGAQHAQMRFRVIVDSQTNFDAWLKNQQAIPVVAATNALAKKGEEEFGKVCAACHTIGGNPKAVGVLGPNLTHLASRKTIAGGMYELTPDNLTRWIRETEAMKSDNKMSLTVQNYLKGLPDDQARKDFVDAVAAYLLSLK